MSSQPPAHRRVIRPHPELGRLYVPGLRARVPGEAGAFYVVTNRQGFRSDVEFAGKPGAEPRILFFGDGYTAGDGCDNAARFPERVGEALGAQVYNYAVTGAGLDQQRLVHERLGRAIPADLVVICVHVEEIDRLERAPLPDGRREGGDPRWRLLAAPLQRFKDDPRVDAARSAVTERLPWLMPAVRRRSAAQPHPGYASPESEGWRAMQAILVRFAEAAAPTPVLIVPLPSRPFYHDGLDPLYQPLFERLGAPSRGVHVLDLTRPLYELPWPDKKRLAFERAPHFSPFGHEQIARVVSAAITDLRLLRDAPAPSLAAPMTLKSPDGSLPVAAVRPSPARASSPRRPAGTFILGISAFHHDSAAALVRDGEIVAAAREASFSRVDDDPRFPARAANYCLEEAGIHQNDLAAVVHHDDAPLAFERLMLTLAAAGPGGRDAWARLLLPWIRDGLHVPQRIRRHLAYDGLVLQAARHRACAASAFYPSSFDQAAILALDGEGATGAIGAGHGREIALLEEVSLAGEAALLHAARRARELTGERRLCLAGGAALRDVDSATLITMGGPERSPQPPPIGEGLFADVWIQPAPGDAAGAVGAALDVWHTYFEKPRSLPAGGRPPKGGDGLGPGYSDAEARAFVEALGLPHVVLDPDKRAAEIAPLLTAGKTVGHFSGRLDLDPRAVGGRAILGKASAAPFRERGEPVVCTPDDAYRCFMRTGMDYLILGDLLLTKRDQPRWSEASEPERRGDAERRLEDEVARLFSSDFLPALRGLGRDAFEARPAPRRDARAAFSIPPALDSSAPEPARMAAAITALWTPGPATEALRPVIARLLAAGLDPRNSG